MIALPNNIQDTRPGLPLSGSPEVLISFSVTLSHSVASYLTSCRGVNPTSQGVCISSRTCTRYSLVTGRPAAAGNRTPVCCVGGVNDNHYTTRPTALPAFPKHGFTWLLCNSMAKNNFPSFDILIHVSRHSFERAV